MSPLPLPALRAAFGDRLQENVPLAPFTSARIGGAADALLTVRTADQLAEAAMQLWALGADFVLLGGGSNVLVSDRGVRAVVIMNRAKAVEFREADPPGVWAESGATFSNLAHRAAAHGLAGLEWAATVPGSLGGAVYGNAGAFGGDTAGNLRWAELLTPAGRERWPVEKLTYGYRTSALKRALRQAQDASGGPGASQPAAVILSAELALSHSTKEAVQVKIQEFSMRRKQTQPPGASMGSMFKNPPGDHAGRLIEAAGLKGTRIGAAEISPVHANFFVNHGETRAADVRALIELAQRRVLEQSGIALELEVELIGEW